MVNESVQRSIIMRNRKQHGLNEFNCYSSGIKVKPEIFGGTSDSRFIRRVCIHQSVHFRLQFVEFFPDFFFQLNISALNFSPLINTVPKSHDHNEYINAETYLNGIEVYRKIVANLANV